MTREQKHQMFDMRLDGYTYERIGERFGISRQRVSQILSGKSTRGNCGARKQKRLDAYVFPNIAVWINENNYTASQFSEEASIDKKSFSGYMRGQHEPTLSAIKAIINLTGLPFEVAFERKVEDNE